MERQIEANKTSCKTATDCKTCHKLPGKHTSQCRDKECWAVSSNSFICKGKPEGLEVAQGGQCNGGKHWTRCPAYVAMCDLGQWSQCSKVFTSPWSHILVHWGIAEEGGPLDFSLPQLGMVWFLLLGVYPLLARFFSFVPLCYSLAGAGSLVFNAYLGWVLKTKLKEFCVVCFSTYIINGSSVLCVWFHFRSTRRGTEGKAQKESKKTNGTAHAVANGKNGKKAQ